MVKPWHQTPHGESAAKGWNSRVEYPGWYYEFDIKQFDSKMCQVSENPVTVRIILKYNNTIIVIRRIDGSFSKVYP